MTRHPPLIPKEEVVAGQRYRLIEDPAVIADVHGNILVWSLPGIVPKRQQVGDVQCEINASCADGD